MPFVKRDEVGNFIAISQEPVSGFDEELPNDDPAIFAFLIDVGGDSASLSATDQDLIRVVEDVVVVKSKGGRPRIHPVITTVKRKAGRPRKIGSLKANSSEGGQEKQAQVKTKEFKQ